jgi:hypothetical protein
MTVDDRKDVLLAIHQVDVADVLGRQFADVWHCSLCGRESKGVPAAFVKRDREMVPLCFSCLLEREAEWTASPGR